MAEPMSTTIDSGAKAVLHVGGMYRGSEDAVVEAALGRRAGVVSVEASAAAQSATVTYDSAVTSVAELQRWVTECGFHCAGRSVPGHICDPLMEAGDGPAPADEAARERAEHAHGDGHGGHTGMSMDAMVREMRNRFLVALVFAVPIVLWSAIGRDVFGLDLPTPFGIDGDVWQLLLSLPVVFYAASIFFTAALAALRARTLDMMVLVAVAVGVGWLYSAAATFAIDGEVFYEAVTVLATFVLMGHWFEMRARGGANDAIRALLDLAPPKAVGIRFHTRRRFTMTTTLAVPDISCAQCEQAIEGAVTSLAGVQRVNVDVVGKVVAVEHDPQIAPVERLARAIEQQGYTVVGYDDTPKTAA